MTQDQPSRLDRLETALARFAEIQLQNNVQHDQTLTHIEGAIAQLTNRVDALTTSTTETIQLVA